MKRLSCLVQTLLIVALVTAVGALAWSWAAVPAADDDGIPEAVKAEARELTRNIERHGGGD